MSNKRATDAPEDDKRSRRRLEADATILESGPLRGAKLLPDKLTTRSCPNVDRWQTSLGSDFLGNDELASSLERFKLDKFRYLETLEPSGVAKLSNLVYLSLTRCSQLTSLPESIGSLKNLKTVSANKKKTTIECAAATISVSLANSEPAFSFMRIF